MVRYFDGTALLSSSNAAIFFAISIFSLSINDA